MAGENLPISLREERAYHEYEARINDEAAAINDSRGQWLAARINRWKANAHRSAADLLINGRAALAALEGEEKA